MDPNASIRMEGWGGVGEGGACGEEEVAAWRRASKRSMFAEIGEEEMVGVAMEAVAGFFLRFFLFLRVVTTVVVVVVVVAGDARGEGAAEKEEFVEGDGSGDIIVCEDELSS